MRWRSSLALCGLVIVTIALRFWGIGSESVWYDEAVAYEHIGESSLFSFLQKEQMKDPPMVPAYFIVLWGWAQLFGMDIVTLRSLSIVFGTACVGMVYLIGKELLNRRAGLLAAACMALSSNNIYYAQEIRMYALLMFLVSVSIWSILRFAATDRPWLLTMNGFANVLMVWTHLFAIFYLFVLALSVMALLRKKLRLLLFWGFPQFANIILCYYLWIKNIDLEYVSRFAHKPVSAGTAWQDLLGSYNLNLGFSSQFFGQRDSIDAGALLLLLMGTFLLMWLKRKQWGAWFLLGVAVIPIGVLLFSQEYIPMFKPRYVQYCCIPIYALAMAGCVMEKRARIIGPAVLLVILLHTVGAERPFRLDWGRVSSIIPKDASIIVLPDFLKLDMACVGYANVSGAKSLDVAIQIADQHEECWIILTEVLDANNISAERLRERLKADFWIMNEHWVSRSPSGQTMFDILHCKRRDIVRGTTSPLCILPFPLYPNEPMGVILHRNPSKES